MSRRCIDPYLDRYSDVSPMSILYTFSDVGIERGDDDQVKIEQSMKEEGKKGRETY
jgi:hypothetical protein